MATVTLPNTFSANTTILSAQVNSNFTTIYNEFNGNISNSNVSSSAAIGVGKIAAAPYCVIRKSADETIATNTYVALSWDTEDADNDTMHDNATNNTRITIRTAGLYISVFHARWNDVGTTTRQILIRLNGTTYQGNEWMGTGHGVGQTHGQAVTAIGNYAVNDYLEAIGFHTGGAGIAIQGGSIRDNSYFTAARIGT